jgi:DNA-binding transcriptional regulator YiaG
MSIRKPRQELITPAELRALRKTTGLSIKRAAVALGIGYRTLEAYELGEVPAPKLVITMLQVLAAKRQAMITGRRKDMLDFLGQPFEVSL